MISQLSIENFKSIKKADLPLGKISVLTGGNNSGKSSFIYSLLAMKNTISNPNKSIDACLTLPFINLGGFQQTVFNKEEDRNISFTALVEEDGLKIGYTLSIGKIISFLEIDCLKPYLFSARLDIAFPYPVNKSEEYCFENESIDVRFNWNGIVGNSFQVSPNNFSDIPGNTSQINTIRNATDILKKIFHLPINDISKIDFVPIQRGFTQPYFNRVPLSEQISSEAEIATLLINDRDLAPKVTYYLEKIVDRIFSVSTTPETSIFNLQTLDKKNGFVSDLVNEGLGTNQLVTMLAKILQQNNKLICIDEPEIHLHPTIIDRLVSVLVEIAINENKQFLISTHSEHFINALLSNVRNEKIACADVKVYYLKKPARETIIEPQYVNIDGQISGGLKHFFAAELSNMKSFFKISD